MGCRRGTGKKLSPNAAAGLTSSTVVKKKNRQSAIKIVSHLAADIRCPGSENGGATGRYKYRYPYCWYTQSSSVTTRHGRAHSLQRPSTTTVITTTTITGTKTTVLTAVVFLQFFCKCTAVTITAVHLHLSWTKSGPKFLREL